MHELGTMQCLRPIECACKELILHIHGDEHPTGSVEESAIDAKEPTYIPGEEENISHNILDSIIEK